MPAEIDPKQAGERLQAEPGAIYLDVRSEMEFDQGHPTGAWNIPILHASPSGMRPNESFLEVAVATLPKDVLIVVGCKSGQRSAMACQALEQAGFAKVINLAGGFHGRTDPYGRVMSPGWLQSGLPSTSDPTPGKSWKELAGRP